MRATRWEALSGHPNIVNILQVGVTESHRPFIVMPYHAAGSLARPSAPGGPDRVARGIAHRREVVRCAGNRASDRHTAPRYQARERARQRLRRTATERLRDRAHRRWVQDGDRVLHRHPVLHRARGARRQTADGRGRRVLARRDDLRADRRQRRRTSARPTRNSSRTICGSPRRPCRTCGPRESLPMSAPRSRRRCRRSRPTRKRRRRNSAANCNWRSGTTG